MAGGDSYRCGAQRKTIRPPETNLNLSVRRAIYGSGRQVDVRAGRVYLPYPYGYRLETWPRVQHGPVCIHHSPPHISTGRGLL